MPGKNGIEATGEIVQTSPHVGVMVITMFEDDPSVFAAMRAGALGYILSKLEVADRAEATLKARDAGLD